MAGYWKIEKEWVQKWGLTATECIVLADCLEQGSSGGVIYNTATCDHATLDRVLHNARQHMGVE